MTHVITLIPGDGIGPEITDAVVGILKASGVSIKWEEHLAGARAFEQGQTVLPVELLDSIRRNQVALKGPVTTPIGEGFSSVNVGLRKSLNLYANVRPVWNLPGIRANSSSRASRSSPRRHRPASQNSRSSTLDNTAERKLRRSTRRTS